MKIDATLVGFIAGTITTLAWLPQLIKSLKTKKTKDLSLGMLFFLSFGIVLWLIYGIMLKELPIVLANGIASGMLFIMLYLKIRHG